MKDKMVFCKRRLFYLLFASLFLFCAEPVLATTFQEAVDGAVAGVVNLNSGEVYYGKAHFGEDVVVNGNGAQVVVSGAGDYSTVGNSVSVELNNLTIDGGENGIYLASGSSLNLDQVTIKNSTNSGVLSQGAAHISITDSNFQNIDQYGINLSDASQAELISGCSFTGIKDRPVLIIGSSNVDSIIDCTIVGDGNTSKDAISILSGSSAVIENCDISQATAGIAVVNNSSAVIIDCHIHDNLKIAGTAKQNGQGIYVLDNSNAQVTGTEVKDNDNAGLYCNDASEIEVGWSVFDHNGWGALDGEGIDCRDDSTGFIHDSKVTGNYLYGIQRTDSSITIEGCEVRNNRLGGINVGPLTAARTPDAVIRGCILDSNDLSSSPDPAYEAVLSGSYTDAVIEQSYFGFNKDYGMLLQNDANAHIESSVFMSNPDMNINVYHANIDMSWSSLSDSGYGIYFNTANTSSVHNTDFFNHSTKHAQSQDSSPYPDCSENWWGDGGDPGSSVYKIKVESWLPERVAFTCLDRGYDLGAGVYKQFSLTDLPIDIELYGGSDAVTDQIFIAYASHKNIFPSLPDPSISFTPSPNNIVYMWVNVSLETRIGAENEAIEFFYDNVNFENPVSGEILKFNGETQQWEALNTTFIANEDRLRADVSDIAGRYILYTNDYVSPTADFTANPTAGDAPLLVEFTDASTDSPTSWSWDFNDGQTSNEQNPVHIFENSESYNVALTVSNPAGDDTFTVTVNVGVCSNKRVWLNGVGFQEIDPAYNAANEGDVLKLQAVTFVGDLIFDRDVGVILWGGYDCSYGNYIGDSIIKGSVTIEAGCLELNHLEVR